MIIVRHTVRFISSAPPPPPSTPTCERCKAQQPESVMLMLVLISHPSLAVQGYFQVSRAEDGRASRVSLDP